jgi:hypothetical protein
MRITIKQLRQLIRETLCESIDENRRFITLKELKQEFPDAYKDLVSGEWENENGRTIKGPKQLKGHDFSVMGGFLWWDNGFEEVAWLPNKQDWGFPDVNDEKRTLGVSGLASEFPQIQNRDSKVRH